MVKQYFTFLRYPLFPLFLCFFSMNGNICYAKNTNTQQEDLPTISVSINESFDATLFHAYYNLALKNSDKAFKVADSLYQNTTIPREQARALMLMASILGKKSEPIYALNHIDRALNLAKENKMMDVLVWALYYKGELYRTLGFYNRGIAMLDEAKDLVPKIKNEYWREKFQTTLVKGEAEMAMANYEYEKAAILLIKITSTYKKWTTTEPEAAAIVGRCYQLLGDCYYNQNDLDRADAAYYSAHNYLNTWNTKNTIYIGRVYLGFGDIHLKRKNFDSTKIYLSKALNIAEESNSNSFKNNVYNSLKEYYKKIDDSYYFTIYVKKQDSIENIINKHNKSMISAMAEYPITDKDDAPTTEKGKGSKSMSIFIYFIIIFSCVLLFILYRTYIRHQNSQKVLKKSKKENQDLKNRLDSSFDELMHLAKTNDPSFLAKFRQVYPDLYKKLNLLNKNLTDSELELCGMVWLKLSSKEIALFTFVQHKTVQIKKYRLRKKLLLPPRTDLYNWLYDLKKNQINSSQEAI